LSTYYNKCKELKLTFSIEYTYTVLIIAIATIVTLFLESL